MEPILRATVSAVDDLKSKKASPIIASFQNAIDDVTKVKIKRVKQDETDRKFALVASSGSVYKSDITETDTSYSKTYLAIRDKTTNEVRLVQVQEASFKHTLYDSKHSEFEGNSKIDVKKTLHKEFGGKKALASFERAKRSAPNVEILEETLDKQLDTIDGEKFFETDEFDQSQVERVKISNSIFPDIDISSGKSVREIFSARKLLGDGILSHLSDVALEVLSTEAKEQRLANAYLNQSVQILKLQKQPDSPQNIEKVSIFMYMDALARIINCRKKILDKTKLSPISQQLGFEVVKKFSLQESMTNSKFTRQKAIIYYLILSLISTDSLSVDINNVLTGVDFSKTELVKYATVIGAKLAGDNLSLKSAKLDSQSKMSAGMPTGKRRRKQ